jgi:tetratricopeptide (TPR) repeat protein
MVKTEVNLISLEIRKWILDTKRLHLNLSYIIGDQENEASVELSLTQATEMVEEFIGKFSSLNEHKMGRKVLLANDKLIREKLGLYFRKVLSELKPAKNRKNKTRSNLPKFLDIYSETQDLSFLSENIQFHILLNWSRRHYEKEDYANAIDPLKKLLKIRPDYGIGYKWLARSLKKMRKYDEAMRYYELYEKVDKSVDSKLELAKSYRKGKLFDKSEKIYREILKNEPENKIARIGLVQIKYARMEKDYLPILDDLYQEDPDWLNRWLNEEFNYRIYTSPKTILPALQAAQYLGYEKAFEITQKAFKNAVPSHFNPSKARMTFYKEELENWTEIVNRYKILDQPILLQPDKIKNFLDDASGPGSNGSDEKFNKKGGNGGTKSTRVEEIIRQIREERAQRKMYNSQLSASFKVSRKRNAEKPDQSDLKSESDKKSESVTKQSINRKKMIASKQKSKVNSGNGQKKRRTKSATSSKSKTGKASSTKVELADEN